MPNADVQFEVQLTETGKGQSRQGGEAVPGAPSGPPPPQKPPVGPQGVGGMGATMQQWFGNLQQSMSQQGASALGPIVGAGVAGATGSPTLGSLAGMGAGGMLGQAAGSFGLPILATMVTSEIANTISRTMDRSVRGLADLFTSPGRVDPVQTALGGIGDLSKAADPLQAIFGINLNLVDDAFRILVSVTQDLIGNFDQLGESMADLSGPVAVAQAEREVARLQTELYRSRVMGPQMAQYVRARTELTEEFERLRIDVQRALLPYATKITQLLTSATSGVESFLESYGDITSLERILTTVALNLGFGPGWGTAIATLLGAVVSKVGDDKPWQDDLEYRQRLEAFLDPGSMFWEHDLPEPPVSKSRAPKVPYGAPLSSTSVNVHGGP